MPSTPLPAQPPSPPRSGNAEAIRSSARRASEPQSPSKRAREAGETSRALVLVGEEEGDAPRAAVASPKRPRAPPASRALVLVGEEEGDAPRSPRVANDSSQREQSDGAIENG